MTINVLFLKKLVVAFVGGFLYVLVQKLTNVGGYAAFSTWHAVWTGLISGAVIAGFRAVLVLLPINLVPSDGGSLLGSNGTTPDSLPAAAPPK